MGYGLRRALVEMGGAAVKIYDMSHDFNGFACKPGRRLTAVRDVTSLGHGRVPDEQNWFYTLVHG